MWLTFLMYLCAESYHLVMHVQERIVEMTLDKEYDVAVQGVRLVISILKYVPVVGVPCVTILCVPNLHN